MESAHYLASRTWLMVRGKIPISLYLRALTYGCVDLSDVKAHRKPISRALLSHLRCVRQQGNWHNIAPLSVPNRQSQ